MKTERVMTKMNNANYVTLSSLYRQTPGLLEHTLKVYHLSNMVVRDIPENILSSLAKRQLITASLLHDLGKCNWPKEWFYTDKSDISDEQWRIMQMHAIQSIELCNALNLILPEDIQRIIKEHHERPEGTGYPYKIEPGAPSMIMAACDVYSACTEPRYYRNNDMTVHEALEQIENFAPHRVLTIIQNCAKCI